MTKCEGCEQEKDVEDIEGNLLCEECSEDIVRCHFCNRLIAISYDILETNCGILSVPELTLPDKGTNLIFCNVDCLEGYIQKYKKELEVDVGSIDNIDNIGNIVDDASKSDVSMEKLFGKWIIYLQKLDTFHKGFDVFTNESDKLGVGELRKIIRGGIDALDEKVDELRDYNEDMEYQMFKSTFRAFLSNEGVDEDIIGDEEKFREEFEGYIHWNVEKLFDFPVLLLDVRTYEVEYNGIHNKIDESVPEQKEFKDKALKFISEEQLNEILINSWDGSGFFGIIISGSDIIKSIKDKKNIVSSSEMVIGIFDGFNGSGYFKRVNIGNIDDIGKDCANRKYEIDLDKAELDWGKYGLGAIFGNVEWKWG